MKHFISHNVSLMKQFIRKHKCIQRGRKVDTSSVRLCDIKCKGDQRLAVCDFLTKLCISAFRRGVQGFFGDGTKCELLFHHHFLSGSSWKKDQQLQHKQGEENKDVMHLMCGARRSPIIMLPWPNTPSLELKVTTLGSG